MIKTAHLKEKQPPSKLKHHYAGRHSHQQVHGNDYKGRKYTQYEQDPYNNYQNFLYNRALFGLGMYTKEEVEVMHKDKKMRIIRVQRRAQAVLNLWKQKIVNQLSNHIFQSVFPESPFTKILLEKHGDTTDKRYNNTIPFKLLRISKEQIINKLVNEGVLPHNFEQLKPIET